MPSSAPKPCSPRTGDSMAEIINLRQARKARERAEREAEAAANRSKHGRSKAQRKLTDIEKKLAEGRLEGHRLTRDDGEP